MKRSILGLGAFALALTVASTAQAQRPVSVGISAGAAVPTGDLGEVSSLGYNVTGSLGYSLPAMPVSFRLDGMWNQMSGKEIGGLTAPDFRIMGLTGNVAYTLPGVALRPYVIAGAGMYNSKADVEGAESRSDLGVNAGLGARFALSGFNTFVEARFHNIFMKDDASGEKTNVQFSPISFGIMF